MKKICSGINKKAVYKHGDVWPYCPDCGANLGVQGKHQKVVRGIIGKHFVEVKP